MEIKKSLLALAAPLVVLNVLFAARSCPAAAPATNNMARLELTQELPNVGELSLYVKSIAAPYKLRGEARSTTDTLFYLELRKRGGTKSIRVWEEACLVDFQRQGCGRPTGFAFGSAEGYTSSVAFVYWILGRVNFCEINPDHAVTSNAEKTLTGLANREWTEEVKFLKDRDWGSHPFPTGIEFRTLVPSYPWDAFDGNPPRVTKIWREADNWNMQIAVGQPEMHLLLRDGAKEWVWVNKP